MLLSSVDTGIPSPLQIATSRFLRRVDAVYDAIRWAPTHRLKPYSPYVMGPRSW